MSMIADPAAADRALQKLFEREPRPTTRPAGDYRRLNARQRLARGDAAREFHRSNEALNNAVIAGFVLEHAETFLVWMEKANLQPGEQRSALSWVFEAAQKDRDTQRAADWLSSRDAGPREAARARIADASFVASTEADQECQRRLEVFYADVQRKSTRKLRASRRFPDSR